MNGLSEKNMAPLSRVSTSIWSLEFTKSLIFTKCNKTLFLKILFVYFYKENYILQKKGVIDPITVPLTNNIPIQMTGTSDDLNF